MLLQVLEVDALLTHALLASVHHFDLSQHLSEKFVFNRVVDRLKMLLLNLVFSATLFIVTSRVRRIFH